MVQPLGSIDKTKTIHIIGAGFSGLILGYFLKQAGCQVQIFEKESEAGGKIKTIQGSKGKAETGAHAFFANAEIKAEFKKLNLKVLSAERKLAKKILVGEKISKLPFSLINLIAILFKLFLVKPPKIESETSIDDFMRPLIGNKIADEVLPAAFIGIYGVGPKELSFQALFPQLKEIHTYLGFLRARKLNRPKGFESVSFAGGMGELIQALRKNLNNELYTNRTIQELPKNSIICTDAADAANLLKNSHPEIARALNGIEYTTLSGVTVLTKTNIPELNRSFGALNAKMDSKIFGILNNYGIFKAQQRSSDLNSYTFIMNTHKNLEQEFYNELRKHKLDHILQGEFEIIQAPWKRAIPKYNAQMVRSLNLLKSQNWDELALFGNYIGGISLREIFFAAKKFAQD